MDEGQFAYYPSTGFGEASSADVVAWKLTRSAIEHENLLISHRMSWLLQSQAFLLTSFGVLYGFLLNKQFAEHWRQIIAAMSIVAAFAIYTALVLQIAIARGNQALDDLTT